MLICSFPPLPPNDFVNLFVFGGAKRNQQLGKEPPRAPAAREAAPGTISGGRCRPESPRFCLFVDFGRGRFGPVLGRFWGPYVPNSIIIR